MDQINRDHTLMEIGPLKLNVCNLLNHCAVFLAQC